jgi:hypothetical protein
MSATDPEDDAELTVAYARAPRPRREVSRGVLWLGRPVLRHSMSRDAFVLRGFGDRMGPVLVRRGRRR